MECDKIYQVDVVVPSWLMWKLWFSVQVKNRSHSTVMVPPPAQVLQMMNEDQQKTESKFSHTHTHPLYYITACIVFYTLPFIQG